MIVIVLGQEHQEGLRHREGSQAKDSGKIKQFIIIFLYSYLDFYISIYPFLSISTGYQYNMFDTVLKDGKLTF